MTLRLRDETYAEDLLAMREDKDRDTRDVVPVIRCRDCRFFSPREDGKGVCAEDHSFSKWFRADDFCSYAEGKKHG